MQYLIVGAGPAGVVAAETLRKLDPAGDIALIGDEPERPYSRMAIPYLLIDQIDEAGTHLRHDPDHYARLRIELVNLKADRVNPASRQVVLNDGRLRSYDRLLLATGSHPVQPPIPGIHHSGVHNCWTLTDARAIIARAKPDARVLLIGAGFIGCIILEALALRKVRLTVVEMGDRMVPRMMNETAGGLIRRWCESRGVAVHTSTRVTAIDSGASGLRVSLSDGTEVESDLVISAAGVKPNTAFLEGSGIECDQGVLVDHYLETSARGVYAAGDVAEGRDFSTGNHMVHAIQPTAAEHGRIAASNMAGRNTYYQGSVNMNVLDTLGLISSSFGLWMGEEGGDQVERMDADAYRYINLQFKDDVLVGATSLGLTEHVGVLRGLIQGRVPLGPWKARLMRDPTRVMEAYLARASAAGVH